MSFKKIPFDYATSCESKSEEGNKGELGCMPTERLGHICESYCDKYLLLWGGLKEDSDTNYANEIWIFNTEIEKWTKVVTEDGPPPLSSASSIITENFLYIFAGFTLTSYSDIRHVHCNDLYKLCLRNFKWQKCKSIGKLPSPRDKLSGWEFNEKLYFFGGFGPCFYDYYLDEIGDFIRIEEYDLNVGWNNQLICYDTVTCTWNVQKCANKFPSPRAAHSSTKISDHEVIVFGGRTNEGRTNDMFILNMNDFSWTEITKKETDIPKQRSWHTMVKLDETLLLLYGGLSDENESLGDAWLFNINNNEWIKIDTDLEKRMWHTAVLSKQDKQIYVLGGSTIDVFYNEPEYPKHMLQISLTPPSLKSKCLNIVGSNIKLYNYQNIQSIPIELQKIILQKYLSLKSLEDLFKELKFC